MSKAAPKVQNRLSAERKARNKPCRCGSGKKYKHCCLLWDRAATNVERQNGSLPPELREVWLQVARAVHAMEQVPEDLPIMSEMKRAFGDPEREQAERNNEVATVKKENDKLERQIRSLEKSLASREAEIEDWKEKAAAGADAATLRERLRREKQNLKAVQTERNELRRELKKVVDALELERTQEKAELPAILQVSEPPTEEISTPRTSRQPARIPVFTARFESELQGLPEPVARSAMRIVGQLAAGNLRGSLKLSTRRDIHRQRVGRNYRLLFRLSPRRLDLLTIVHRSAFDETVRSMGE